MATRKAATTNRKSTTARTTARPTSRTKTVTRVKSVTEKPTVKQAKTVAATSRVSRRSSLSEKLTDTRLLAGLIAEFVGTFLLAAVALHPQLGSAPFVMLFAIMGIIVVLGPISGGYINPAMTIAGWVTRRLSGVRTLAYIVMQVLGALLAMMFLTMFMNQQKPVDPMAAMYGGGGNIELAKVATAQGKEWFIFVAELVGTMIFALGVAAATRGLTDRVTKGLSVGGALMLAMIISGLGALTLGGTVVFNPAVAAAMQAFNNATTMSIATYVAGTTIGAVLGFALYDMMAKAVRAER